MIALLPLIFLIFRYRNFSRLARTSQHEEAYLMRHYSGIALKSFIFFAILSFSPYFFATLKQTDILSISIIATVIGIVVAVIFDLKAERVKRRCGIGKSIDPDRVICPKCGHSNSMHRVTCKNCHVNLSQAMSDNQKEEVQNLEKKPPHPEQ